MSRCTCPGSFRRCGDGPCDCTCTDAEVKDYLEQELRRRNDQVATYNALKAKALKLGLTEAEIARLEWGS